MTDSKYSALPPAALLTGTEIFAVDQAGNSVRTTVSAVQNNALGIYTAPGIGAVARTVSAKFGDMLSVLDYGADPAGVADSSAAFTAAFATGASFVYVPPPNSGAQYIVHDVVIPSGCTLFAYGAYFKDAVGANWVFKLKGFSARLLGAYISSASNCAQAAVIVENGILVEVCGVRVLNSINAFRTQSTGSGSPAYTDHVQFTDCYADVFTGIGFYAGPNVSEIRALNCYMDGGLVAGGGGLVPRPSTTGFVLDGTGSTVAFGGHAFTQCQVSNTQEGWYLKNSNLVLMTGCIADGNSARGFALDGNTNICTMTGCFTGPAFVGIWAGGTTTGNWATGLTTINNGVIPPTGGTTYYTSAAAGYNGYTAPGAALDIQTAGTANFVVAADTWLATQGTAHAYNQGAGSNLNITGGERLNFGTPTTVPATATNFIGPSTFVATDQTNFWIAPFSCTAQAFKVYFNVAPGAGTYTYTMSVNGTPTALTGSATGAVFSVVVDNGTQVGIAKGAEITLKLVTAAGGVAFHAGYIHLLPQP